MRTDLQRSGARSCAGTARTLARVRSRAAKRGAAFVEAVIVIPFFIIIFAGVMYVGKLYDAKLTVMREARQSAWTEAMSNCGTPGDPNTTRAQASTGGPSARTEGLGAAQPDGVEGQLEQALRIGGEVPHKDIATKTFTGSQAEQDHTVTADQPIGAFAKTVTGNSHVMCNEAPFDANQTQFRQAALSSFRDAVLGH